MNSFRLGFLFILIALPTIIATAFFSGPVSQDPAYHAFADSRPILGVGNFWNIVSNLPFLIVGGLGARTAFELRAEPTFPAWLTFFAGILLTALGSGWYHLDPSNDSLFWDRLAMSVAYMGLFAVIIGEYRSPQFANRLLLPLLVTGAASVFYWIHTEQLGAGDLRPYILIQFLPMLLIPLIVLAGQSRGGFGFYLALAAFLYFLAKLAEYYDDELFASIGLLSGHSAKHLLAASAAAIILRGLMRLKGRGSAVTGFPK